MAKGQLEVLVEPFKENEPGPHVAATLDALTDAGLEVDMGPFSTTANGELTKLVGAVHAMLQSGFDAGASTIQIRLTRIDD
ncbi:MAG: hypothetical protein GY724_24605 [Actinomycetia bacterium]|nr:hypothetical protein [Actinomycetes bacterium]MCP4224085.1 hypothetical protein [Actinomycetes bacterium]MCP5033110.1 hypothetical protein [Actinomycetes bacterium]